MPIRSMDELRGASKQAGELLQEIHDYCRANNLTWSECEEARVRFPRGFIRPASEQRGRLTFVEEGNLRDNLAYTLILSDVVLWMLIRTDLWGTPRHMLTKMYAFIVAALCESMTKVHLAGICGQNFKRRNEYMLANQIIDEATKQDLDWLWDLRNRMHLFQLNAREYENEYSDGCQVRVVKTFRSLIKALKAHSARRTDRPDR